MSAEERLRAAGWEVDTTLRMVTLPSELGDDELFYWRSPDGRVLTEAKALEQLEQEAKGEEAMTDWSIEVPYKFRDDHVLCATDAAKESGMREDQQQVVDVLAGDALVRGITTVGGLLDELQDLSEAEVRQRLDWAREKAGMVSATESDRRTEQRRVNARFADADVPPPPRWEGEWQQCHGPDCTAWPTRENGAIRPVTVQKWFCDAHKHLAQSGDLEEHESPYTGLFTSTGVPIPTEREKARVAAWIERREEEEKRERELLEEHRDAEAEAIAEAKQRYLKDGEISVAGIKCRPDGKIIP